MVLKYKQKYESNYPCDALLSPFDPTPAPLRQTQPNPNPKRIPVSQRIRTKTIRARKHIMSVTPAPVEAPPSEKQTMAKHFFENRKCFFVNIKFIV